MEASRHFKFDVRIRARLLARGQITEAEVAKHLEGLVDLESQSEVVNMSQPAIGVPPERPRPMPRPVQPRPIARPVVPIDAIDDAWDDDDDDDEEEDLKPKKVAAVAPKSVPKVEAAEEPAAVAASTDDDEDDLVAEDATAGEDEE